MFVSHFRGLSVTFDGLYTYFPLRLRCILSLQMKVTPLQMFLSSHYCQNGNQTILTHPRHLTLCVWEVMLHFDRWSRFQTWKYFHLNSTLNWRTLHGLSMYLQHCREFEVELLIELNHTQNVYFFFIRRQNKLSAWELKRRWNSYSCIICSMVLLKWFCGSIYRHISYLKAKQLNIW